MRSINTIAYQNRNQSVDGPETCKKNIRNFSPDLVAARGCADGVNVRTKQCSLAVHLSETEMWLTNFFTAARRSSFPWYKIAQSKISCKINTGSFPGLKRSGRGVGHPPFVTLRSRIGWSYTSTFNLCLHTQVVEWPSPLLSKMLVWFLIHLCKVGVT